MPWTKAGEGDRLVSRRTFGRLLGASALLRAAQAKGSALIEKITIARMPGEFPRPVGMNSRGAAPAGSALSRRVGSAEVVRVILSDGTVGIGRGRAAPFLKGMIGVDPLDVYTWSGDRIGAMRAQYRSLLVGDPQNSWFEGPLLDVIGRLKNKPVYRLFGEAIRDGIDAYDSSVYFEDVAWHRGPEIIGEVAAQIRKDGYRALKLKVGRPFKWVPGESGILRDIECFIAAREAVGTNFNIMTDANNGYEGHMDWAVRYLKACSSYQMYWIEEIFPEEVGEYRKFIRALVDNNAYVPIADGESVRDMEEFRPFLEAGLYRYIQPDMRSRGVTNILRAAELAESHGVNVAPHNWACEIGRIMSMHMAKIRKNIPIIEDDRFHNFAIDSSAYLFKDGQWFVPERPGWGADISPNYEQLIRGTEEIVIKA